MEPESHIPVLNLAQAPSPEQRGLDTDLGTVVPLCITPTQCRTASEISPSWDVRSYLTFCRRSYNQRSHCIAKLEGSHCILKLKQRDLTISLKLKEISLYLKLILTYSQGSQHCAHPWLFHPPSTPSCARSVPGGASSHQLQTALH